MTSWPRSGQAGPTARCSCRGIRRPRNRDTTRLVSPARSRRCRNAGDRAKLPGRWRVYWSVPTTLLRLVCAVLLLLPLAAGAKPDPVAWSAAAHERQPDGTIIVVVSARIERGWYIYGMRQPEDGPAPLRFRGPAGSGVAVGPVQTPMPRVSYDKGFRARVGKHYDTPSFLVPVRLSRSAPHVAIEVRYQACNDDVCLPPRTVAVQASLTAGR
jgi:hypothetical protein